MTDQTRSDAMPDIDHDTAGVLTAAELQAIRADLRRMHRDGDAGRAALGRILAAVPRLLAHADQPCAHVDSLTGAVLCNHGGPCWPDCPAWDHRNWPPAQPPQDDPQPRDLAAPVRMVLDSLDGYVDTFQGDFHAGAKAVAVYVDIVLRAALAEPTSGSKS